MGRTAHRRRVPAHLVVVVAYDGIQGLDLTGPYEVFAGAGAAIDHLHPGRSGYDVRVVAPPSSATGLGDGRLAVTAETGLPFVAERVDSLPDGPIGTLVVPGGRGARGHAPDSELITVVRRLAARSGRVLTVCTGAFVAADAGLLDGRRVTTHWARAAQLARDHPAVDVDPDAIHLRDERADGEVWTSAGVTAGIDLALAVVEHDHGADVAQFIARWLVMFLRRPGGQSQFAAPVWTERAELEPIRHAQDLVDSDPGADHRVGLLAARVGMSERHFARRFSEQTGLSPAQYVAAVRIDAARHALESTNDTVDAIARRCGFGTAETMRRTFTRRVGVSPDRYRRRFRTGPEPARRLP